MIGILKALGARNMSIRKVFIYNAIFIIGKGMLWGNAVGIGICLLQKYFKIIKIPQESYFMTYVPIHMNLVQLLAINAGTLFICTMMLLIPSFIVSRITPVKAIRFD
jgi:lipoprotein-releasing system permease protein